MTEDFCGIEFPKYTRWGWLWRRIQPWKWKLVRLENGIKFLMWRGK
jgi:hypothetical protein